MERKILAGMTSSGSSERATICIVLGVRFRVERVTRYLTIFQKRRECAAMSMSEPPAAVQRIDKGRLFTMRRPLVRDADSHPPDHHVGASGLTTSKRANTVRGSRSGIFQFQKFGETKLVYSCLDLGFMQGYVIPL